MLVQVWLSRGSYLRQTSRQHFEERISYRVSIYISAELCLKNAKEVYCYFLEPHSVVCSSMCGTPVASGGFVWSIVQKQEINTSRALLTLKPIEKTLFLSSLEMCNNSAPVFSCTYCDALSSNSGMVLVLCKKKPCSLYPICSVA